MAIQSFADIYTEELFTTGKAHKRARWHGVRKIALRKLDMLHYAHTLEDLRSPPANRLEALKGTLKGYYSSRINEQWRTVFVWTPQGPAQVRIVDYH